MVQLYCAFQSYLGGIIFLLVLVKVEKFIFCPKSDDCVEEYHNYHLFPIIDFVKTPLLNDISELFEAYVILNLLFLLLFSNFWAFLEMYQQLTVVFAEELNSLGMLLILFLLFLNFLIMLIVCFILVVFWILALTLRL